MKVRFGMLMTEAVGKAGGQFIQRTRFANVLRNITIPVQWLASLQNPQRTANSFLFARWSFLAPDIRAMWDVIGSNLITKNPFGDDVAMSGRDAFTSCSSLVYPMTNSIVSANAFSYVRPFTNFESVSVDTSGAEINFNDIDYRDVDFYQVKGAILKNGSINLNLKKLKTFYRDSSVSNGGNIFDYFNDRIGVVSAGDWVQIAIRGISFSGLASEWQMFKVRVQ